MDLVAESTDGDALLVGEVKWTRARNVGRLLEDVETKAARLPFAADRKVLTAVWLKDRPEDGEPQRLLTPGEVLGVLR